MVVRGEWQGKEKEKKIVPDNCIEIDYSSWIKQCTVHIAVKGKPDGTSHLSPWISGVFENI